MKSILSLGETTTLVLPKFNSNLSNDAAGADNIVLVFFIDFISSIQNFCV